MSLALLRDRTDDEADRFGELVGRSAAMRALFEQLRNVARSHSTVLLEGASGSGKGRVAHEIHRHSARAARPFVVLSCDRRRESEFESELFGEMRGAFSAADWPRSGAFERAHGGTLFLDGVDELMLTSQARLLRAVDTRRLRKLGSDSLRRFDVRIIASSHGPLLARCREGTFRPDLYYRLAVLPVRVPSLRERLDDLPELIAGMLDEEGIHDPLAPGIVAAGAVGWTHLKAERWEGNLHELRAVVKRLALGVEDTRRVRTPPEERTLQSGTPAPTGARRAASGE